MKNWIIAKTSRGIEQQITSILAGLFLLDLGLSLWVFSPHSWTRAVHGTIAIDPHGLFPRVAAKWAAFAIIQAIALVQWRKQPYWLFIVAGARFGDVLTDWTYLAAADSRAEFGWFALGSASPGNLILGYILFTHAKRLCGVGRK